MRFLNDDFKSEKAVRTAVKISLEEFKEKFIKYIYECLETEKDILDNDGWYSQNVNKNLEKADIEDSYIVSAFSFVFDMMRYNMIAGKDIIDFGFNAENVYPAKDLCFTTLSNGLTCLCLEVNGDWETEVFVLIYYDGETFRAYIPIRGNTIRQDNLYAFGNEYEFEEFEDFINDEDYLKKYEVVIPDHGISYVQYNTCEIIKDVLEVIKVV